MQSPTAQAIEHFSHAGQQLGLLQRAAVLLCLSCAERLPAANWPALLRHLLQSTRPTPPSNPQHSNLPLRGGAEMPEEAGQREVTGACCALLLAHAGDGGLGLGPLLYELLQPARFAMLHASSQVTAL